MTVKEVKTMTFEELLEIKYREAMKDMTASCWEDIKYQSNFRNIHPVHWLYLCLPIYDSDISKYLVSDLHFYMDNKFVKGNFNSNDRIKVCQLTEKGFKYLNRNNAICDE